jgi:HPt (histidine-containing phosphotransfer) domain-containing protein
LDRYLQEKDLSKTKAQIHKLKSSLEIFGLQSIAAEMALIPGYMVEENGDFKIQTTVNHINQALSEFYKQLKPNHQLTETY